jgi:hypothetical protein
MTLLALNTVLLQSMRVKYQVALGVLPIGLMFASFLPLFAFAPWLEAALGMPPNGPIKRHPNGTLWIAIFLGAMVISMVLGYAVGWVVNAAIARLVFSWSAEKVRAVYLQSDIPSHWLKDGADSAQDAKAQVLAKWEEQRKAGAVRFILSRGVLAWGAPMLLVMYIGPRLVKGQSFGAGDILFNLSLWAAAGAAFGAVIWFSSESNYRKLKERK